MDKYKIGDKVRIKGGFVYDDYKEGEYETITDIKENAKGKKVYILNNFLPYKKKQLEPYNGA